MAARLVDPFKGPGAGNAVDLVGEGGAFVLSSLAFRAVSRSVTGITGVVDTGMVVGEGRGDLLVDADT